MCQDGAPGFSRARLRPRPVMRLRSAEVEVHRNLHGTTEQVQTDHRPVCLAGYLLLPCLGALRGIHNGDPAGRLVGERALASGWLRAPEYGEDDLPVHRSIPFS